MIVFLGDSFTWGQGLPIEKWIGETEKTIEDSNKLMPPTYPSELYSYEDDLYRKQNHFPNIVSKYFNKSYVTKFGNGGTNQDIIDILYNMGRQCQPAGVDFYVIQFTEVSRDLTLHENIKDFSHKIDREPDEVFNQYMEAQVNKINNVIVNNFGKKWYGISWRHDFSEILENLYPENYIPIEYGGMTYNNFDELMVKNTNLTLYGKYPGIDDGHLCSEGHQVLANSIIKKISSN